MQLSRRGRATLLVIVSLLVLAGAASLLARAGRTTLGSSSPEPALVLFLGDSITGSPGCWRSAVWTTVTDAGFEVDMVGPL